MISFVLIFKTPCKMLLRLEARAGIEPAQTCPMSDECCGRGK